MRRYRGAVLAMYCMVIVFVLILGFDITQQFTRNRSFSASVYYRLRGVWSKEESSVSSSSDLLEPSVDCCFSDFLSLIRGRNLSEQVFFLEPHPPIPISHLPKRCRQVLVPKPLPTSLPPDAVRCYSRQPVTSKTRPRVREGLRIVKKLFDDNQVPLIATGGSLLGSLRYHGMIPYDDDFDFRMPRDKRQKAKELLADLCRRDHRFRCDLTLTKMDHFQILIGIQNPKLKDYVSFIDIFFYDVSGDQILVTDGPRAYPKSILLPSIKRPLEGLLFDVPRDPRAYQKLYYKKYGVGECHAYDHVGTQRKGCQRVRCSDLNAILPFMVTAEHHKASLELVVKDSHVQSIFLQRKV